MNFCTSCTPAPPFPDKGFLLLHNLERNFKPSKFTEYADGSLSIPYSNVKELASLLQDLHEQTNTSLLKGALSKDPEQPLAYSPFSYIYERVIYKDLVSIINKGDFLSFFQPIVNLESGKIFGYESLLRSFDPPVSPFKLFDTAIKTGMQSILDRRARELAIIARSNKIQRGVKSFINFIPSSIYNPEHCLQHTFKMVKQYGVSPDDLIFEVVETEKISDMEHLKSILETYRANGMKVALDDMGSGYSTYEVLENLKPDFVKIDREYITDCHKNYGKQTFLKNVQALANDLSITVLAEGIETEDEYTFLQSIGIPLGQGYLIGKPEETPAAQEKLFAGVVQ
ncbi:EAL domain-containing protein [Metabacillus sp. KIGAM252]|uniref:EAL domain-containing protein n=1 Tax=Metabacillus flavus TaxID=2823519 RepID=A0ABS5LDD2_9BACI|nr:EAL domain-containing protein [Metabacillus flavus]MBS2968603.1 EAL domain-containing protein [Metabacillus flavus]